MIVYVTCFRQTTEHSLSRPVLPDAIFGMRELQLLSKRRGRDVSRHMNLPMIVDIISICIQMHIGTRTWLTSGEGNTKCTCSFALTALILRQSQFVRGSCGLPGPDGRGDGQRLRCLVLRQCSSCDELRGLDIFAHHPKSFISAPLQVPHKSRLICVLAGRRSEVSFEDLALSGESSTQVLDLLIYERVGRISVVSRTCNPRECCAYFQKAHYHDSECFSTRSRCYYIEHFTDPYYGTKNMQTSSSKQ